MRSGEALFLKIQRMIRSARRRRGSTDADRKILDALEESALSSCTTYMALTSLRSRLIKLFMESTGRLFEFMLLWCLGDLVLSVQCSAVDALIGVKAREDLAKFRLKTSEEQVDEILAGSSLLPAASKILHSDVFILLQGKARLNAYQVVLEDSREIIQKKFPALLREFALLEKPFSFPESPLKFKQVKLSDPEQAELLELASTLREQKELFLLCAPKPTLTHLENFRLALLHARLWLLRSELPVCFGHHVTYNDLRSGSTYEDLTFQCMMLERSREQFPSLTETDLMRETVLAHSMLKANHEVYHMRSEDFLKSSGWNIPGCTAVITQGRKETSVDFLATKPGIEEENDVEITVRAYEDLETSRVLAQLRKINPDSFARFSKNGR